MKFEIKQDNKIPNWLLLILALLVGLCYFGEKHCPAVLKQNKQLLLGVLIGLGSASFMGVGIEGLLVPDCQALLDKQGGDHLPKEGDPGAGFVPPPCKGYPIEGGGRDSYETTGAESGWCANQTDKTLCSEKPLNEVCQEQPRGGN